VLLEELACLVVATNSHQLRSDSRKGCQHISTSINVVQVIGSMLLRLMLGTGLEHAVVVPTRSWSSVQVSKVVDLQHKT
jgi:hypothetical protein